jgi:hypothetical protein
MWRSLMDFIFKWLGLLKQLLFILIGIPFGIVAGLIGYIFGTIRTAFLRAYLYGK